MSRMYSVGEISQFFGISRDTIRHYDSLGILPALRNEENNYRTYRRVDLLSLHYISTLRELDVSLEDIKTIMRSNTLDVHRETVARRQAELDAEIARLQDMRRCAADFDEALRVADTELNRMQLVHDLTVVYCEQEYTGAATLKNIVDDFRAVVPGSIPLFTFLSSKEWFSEEHIHDLLAYYDNLRERKNRDLFRLKAEHDYTHAAMSAVIEGRLAGPLPAGLSAISAHRWLRMAICLETDRDYSALGNFWQRQTKGATGRPAICSAGRCSSACTRRRALTITTFYCRLNNLRFLDSKLSNGSTVKVCT